MIAKEQKKETTGYQAVKKKNIYTKLIIDGWGNYKNKMSFQKNKFLPQEIITFDVPAYRIISKLIRKTKVKLYKNLIFDCSQQFKTSYQEHLLALDTGYSFKIKKIRLDESRVMFYVTVHGKIAPLLLLSQLILYQ